ncbi:MAG: ATP-binding cassette domain-containing protein [SAR202 cluster bacterium]|nr:ATP-binding cassette domain-containing protein [SAR202 cluster bacterium]|tara:strand:- start:2165 stop:2782 length:618 start_codon:yes stop_codon:yes gene_type:complete
MVKSFIEVEKLSKTFDEKKVLDKLSFNVAEGEIVKISGNNGSGKSTLLKIIARIYSQDSGLIRIQDEKISSSSLSKSKVSYASSDFIYYKDLTVKKNLLFFLSLIGEDNNIYENNKTFLDIDKFENLYPDTLSNGQKKKMNLFRCLVPKYEIYLLDEPENGLDDKSKKDLDNKLIELSKNSTIIYTSHNIGLLSIYDKTSKEIKL